MENKVSFVIVTGLSGAGKTNAMKILEDLDFFCIDNLPPSLLPQLVSLHAQSNEERKFAIAIDIRVREYFSHLFDALRWLEGSGYHYQIIFLDCQDHVLVKRYSETRRLHPLGKEQEGIYDSIAAERKLLADVRQRADEILDTTEMRPTDVRVRLNEIFTGKPLHKLLTVDVFSFGFKYGVPMDADMVFDVRFVPNPFYLDELKPYTGQDKEVADFIFRFPIANEFLQDVPKLINKLIPYYSKEGKARLTIGIGCTGGQHRSVAMAISLGERLQELGIQTVVRHREFTNPQFPGIINSSEKPK